MMTDTESAMGWWLGGNSEIYLENLYCGPKISAFADLGTKSRTHIQFRNLEEMTKDTGWIVQVTWKEGKKELDNLENQREQVIRRKTSKVKIL